MRTTHRDNPLHRIEFWTGQYFQAAQLQEVGTYLLVPHSSGKALCDTLQLQQEQLEKYQVVYDVEEQKNHHTEKQNDPAGPHANPADAADITEQTSYDAQDDNYMTRLSRTYGLEPGFHPIAEDGSTLDTVEVEVDEEDDDDTGLYDDLPARMPRHDAFNNPYVRIVYVNGIHYIPLVFCSCRGVNRVNTDLMHKRLVPASFTRYKTLFTTAVLDDYRLANLECKASAFQYWHKLSRTTAAATSSADIDNFYRKLRWLSRSWRWLKKLKRGGFGNNNRDPMETTAGELAIFCPTCPQLLGERPFTPSDAHRLSPDTCDRSRPIAPPTPTLRPKRRCTYLYIPVATSPSSARPIPTSDIPTSVARPRARALSHKDRTASGTCTYTRRCPSVIIYVPYTPESRPSRILLVYGHPPDMGESFTLFSLDSPLPETRRSRPIRFRAETRVCYTRPSNARSLRSPAQSRFEMSEFGDMSQRPFSPFLTTEERLANMEATISALSASNTSNSASMDRLSALFEKFMSGTPPNPTPAAPEADTTTPPPETTTLLPGSPRSGSHHLRPSPPPIYDGARLGGRAFLNACKLYFSLCGEVLPTTTPKYRVFQFGTAKDVFPAWKDFEDTFRGEFFLFDEVADAALILESTAYFQNSRSIDEYIDSFRSLWVKAGYPDGRHLVLKFRRGMDPKLSRRLGSITTGRPHDEKIEEWLRIARSQDFIMRSEDDFHRRMVPTKAPDSRQPTAAAARWAFATAPAPAPAPAPPAPRAPVAPAPRPIPQGIPMDVDRMRDRVAPADDHCFRCKKKGHYSRDCPLRWDVRHMLDDELEALIMERLARKDAVPADPTPSSADATASDAEEGF
ncbi:hypothetical protein D9615_008526 [Tricholomella constricta]|uniref:CCHC-type domain-containing protein n=1 Tax=Tricholomella constricta TaxID=117010 RepID=A0A8H5H4H2_9AGAR|nr:hypothetical protein D9615_008526 [Tricholomella constricta]